MHKKIVKSSSILTLILAAISLSLPCSPRTSAVEQDAEVEVNVNEILSVNITTPSSWASGVAGTFLRNKITIDVVSNNPQGFTASMVASDTNAELKHSSKDTSISTFDSGVSYTCTDNATCPEFPNNKWGYTIDDGVNLNVYHPMVGSGDSPISLISSAESTQQSPITSRDIYFGAKANLSQTSGTYSGTVIFYIVSGAIAIDQDPESPSSSPANTPAASPSNSPASYSALSISNSTTSTPTTVTSQGSTLGSYQDPAGVTNSTTNSSNIYDDSMSATGLVVAASVAATSGIILFIIAKRKKDDEEEQQ